MTGADGQQSDRRDMRGGAGTRAAGQMHVQCLTMTLQQRGQLQGVALGVGQAFAAAARTGAGDQPRQGLIGFAQQAQLMQAADDFGCIFVANVRATAGFATG